MDIEIDDRDALGAMGRLRVAGGYRRGVEKAKSHRRGALRMVTRRTHGEIGYPEPRAKAVGNLIGAPIRDKLLHYAPVEEASKVKDCAALFIVAEKEELFDNNAHAKLAYDRMPGTKKKYVSLPNITHYGVYTQERPQAIKLAIEWFDQYLKK